MAQHKGRFITLEGTEGAGKSTALAFIEHYLTQHGHVVLVTREPGGTPFAEAIRHLLLHASAEEKVEAHTELLLMFAARAQHIATTLMPALNDGTWVVSDRYVDASYAYQGGGRGVAMADIAMLDRMVVADCYPDLTLLLDLPVAMGAERAHKRSQKDRIEQENMAFFTRVQQAYLARAAAEPERIKIIDAGCTLPEVERQIRAALDAFVLNIKVDKKK